MHQVITKALKKLKNLPTIFVLPEATSTCNIPQVRSLRCNKSESRSGCLICLLIERKIFSRIHERRFLFRVKIWKLRHAMTKRDRGTLGSGKLHIAVQQSNDTSIPRSSLFSSLINAFYTQIIRYRLNYTRTRNERQFQYERVSIFFFLFSSRRERVHIRAAV